MRADELELSSPLFSERVLPFVCDGAPREPIVCEIAGQQFALRKTTKRNGYFSQTFQVTLTPSDCEQANACPGPWPLPVRIVRPLLNTEYHGRVFVYRPQGWSVVSDIDDTIKESEINDRQSMLVNTFLRKFKAVDQMAQVYDEWRQMGADFHYVSSSPWQLLNPLSQLLLDSHFPMGSVHLRPFRLRNHMLQRMIRIRRTQKARVIRSLIRAMPQRKFVLIGDSGEKDLQIYGKLARKYPQQIMAVLIRSLLQHPLEPDRLQKLQNRCERVRFRQFVTIDELRTISADLFQETRTENRPDAIDR